VCCAPGFLGGGNEAPLGAGCNCIFDNNTIDTVSYECSDTGAFYTCGQQATAWVNRGNVLKNSVFKKGSLKMVMLLDSFACCPSR